MKRRRKNKSDLAEFSQTITVTAETLLDGEAVAQRSKIRQRGVNHSCGPDKPKPFGTAISGRIDGFSKIFFPFIRFS